MRLHSLPLRHQVSCKLYTICNLQGYKRKQGSLAHAPVGRPLPSSTCGREACTGKACPKALRWCCWVSRSQTEVSAVDDLNLTYGCPQPVKRPSLRMPRPHRFEVCALQFCSQSERLKQGEAALHMRILESKIDRSLTARIWQVSLQCRSPAGNSVTCPVRPIHLLYSSLGTRLPCADAKCLCSRGQSAQLWGSCWDAPQTMEWGHHQLLVLPLHQSKGCS